MPVTAPCHDCGAKVRNAAMPRKWLCGTCSASPPRAAPDPPPDVVLIVSLMAAGAVCAVAVATAVASGLMRRNT